MGGSRGLTGKREKGKSRNMYKGPRGIHNEWGLTVVRELGGAGESNRGKGGTTLIEQQLKAIIPSLFCQCQRFSLLL